MAEKAPASGVTMEVRRAAKGADLAVAEASGNGETRHYLTGDGHVAISCSEQAAASAQAGEQQSTERILCG